MVASIGAVAAPAQGASYYERDGYYAKDDPAHKEASAWAGKGAEDLGLSGPVDPDVFRAVLEGEVPDGSGSRLGRRGKDGGIHHRPGRDLTLSAPKSVSLLALVGGDARVIEAHDRAVARTLTWVERERRRDPHERPRDRRDRPCRRSEDRRRDLSARRLAQHGPPAPHPFRDRQHGPGC